MLCRMMLGLGFAGRFKLAGCGVDGLAIDDGLAGWAVLFHGEEHVVLDGLLL